MFKIEFTVRDYELDLQGIVNNAVYQNYLEHTRHEFLKHLGLDFAEHHADGFDAVVHNVNLTYKRALQSGDAFYVTADIRKEGHLRIVFDQNIYKENGTLVLQGQVTAVFMTNGRPIRIPTKVLTAMEDWVKQRDQK